jgi:hypothetical protein
MVLNLSGSRGAVTLPGSFMGLGRAGASAKVTGGFSGTEKRGQRSPSHQKTSAAIGLWCMVS